MNKKEYKPFNNCRRPCKRQVLNVHRLCRVGDLIESLFIDIVCIGKISKIMKAITAIIGIIFDEFILI